MVLAYSPILMENIMTETGKIIKYKIGKYQAKSGGWGIEISTEEILEMESKKKKNAGSRPLWHPPLLFFGKDLTNLTRSFP